MHPLSTSCLIQTVVRELLHPSCLQVSCSVMPHKLNLPVAPCTACRNSKQISASMSGEGNHPHFQILGKMLDFFNFSPTFRHEPANLEERMLTSIPCFEIRLRMNLRRGALVPHQNHTKV